MKITLQTTRYRHLKRISTILTFLKRKPASVKMMLLTTILLALAAMALTTGCSADDRLAGTVCIDGVNATDIVAENVTSQNVTVIYLISNNVTAGTLKLTDLPTSDPGIPGAIWSDNGTLKVSP